MKAKKILLPLLLCTLLSVLGAEGFVIVESKHVHELNPQVTSYSSDSQILCGLYEGLFSYNPTTLDAEYALANDLHVSRDKKRWAIKLRENAKFSNGESITAASVRDSWLQLLSNPQAPYSSLLDIIWKAADFRAGKCSAEEVGISITGDYSLSIRLREPANYLPKLLCHTAFSIIHRIPTVYSGPYMLENQTEDSYFLKKNPYYWDADNVKLEEITFLQSDDEKENAYLFNTGKADWVMGSIETDRVLNKQSIQMSASFGTAYYFFRNSKKNLIKNGQFTPWDYPEFRNAVLEALPWTNLRSGALVPATTFVYPLAGYNSPQGFDFTDLNEAKLQMDAAREKYNLGKEETLQLIFEVSQYTLTEEKKNLLVEALKPLGIELVIRELPSFMYLSNVALSDADMFAYTWIGDFADPLAFLELYRSTSSLNDSGWANAEFDSLLDKAAEASDYERYDLLAKAEQILLDSAMVIPVYHPVAFNIININEVGGWSTNAFDIHPLKSIYKKEGKSSAVNVVIR